jgi:hypothetical protein
MDETTIKTKTMTKRQMIHVSMLNSYNLITGKNTFDDILKSNIAMFAHQPDEMLDIENIEFMIQYFQELDMYELCIDLVEYKNKMFDDEGNFISKLCECEYPSIKDYSLETKCSTCNNTIVR